MRRLEGCARVPEIVDTPEQAAEQELAPLHRPRAAGGLPRRARAGRRPARGRADRRGPLQRDLPGPARRRPVRAAPPAAAAAAPLGARRAARGPPAHRAGGHRRADAARARHLRRRGDPRRALLRDGGGGRQRDHQRRAARRSTIPSSGGRIGDELVDALVEIHAVDWQAAGLEGFGKPTGYLDRQLRRFNGLWEHNKTRELPIVQRGGRLAGAPTSPSPPHGDDRARRLPPGQRDGGRRAARRRGGDLRLGAGHDRRPAGRRGLPDRSPGRRRAIPRTPRSARSPPPPGKEGFPTREELIAPLRGALRALGRGAQLVRRAGAVEGRRVHGGQPQALPGRLAPTTSYLGLFVEGVPMLAEKAREVAHS